MDNGNLMMASAYTIVGPDFERNPIDYIEVVRTGELQRRGRFVVSVLDVDVWAIRRGAGACLSRDGKWVREPQPSSRTDEWLAEHRFTLEEATILAERKARLA